jgi:tRNA(Ile)-lysidine synthase
VPHETLPWEGEKPETGIQAAARKARYRLLCQACERMGIEHLITAHNADDQAETVFMRLRRGAGRGLAGMKLRRKIAAGPGELITLHRPLLGVRRTELRAYAEAAGLPFVDDPSNEDEGYERVRVRALLAALEQQDLLTVGALCDVAADTTSAWQAWQRDVADETHQLRPRITSDGAIDFINGIAVDRFAAIKPGFAALTNWSSSRPKGKEQPGPKDQPMWVDGSHAGNVSRMNATTLFGATPERRMPQLPFTAQGVVAITSTDANVLLYREPAALLGRADGTPGLAPVPAPPGSKHLYDRRFIVSVPEDAPEGLHLRPLGQLLPRDIATSTLARQRIATLPCLARGETLTHLPATAAEAVTNALTGWKGCDGFLSAFSSTFPAHSLLAERFAGDVIRY